MLAHCFVAYLKLTDVQNVDHSTNALLIITCNKVAYITQGCWWYRNRGGFSFMPQLLKCSWFMMQTVFFKSPTGKSLVMLSQEIGVDTPHSFSPSPSSHSAKYDVHWFYRHQSHDSIAIRTF
jgi:hypothetical protein